MASSFIRTLFLGLCIIFATACILSGTTWNEYLPRLALGIVSGIAFWFLTINLERLFKKITIRTFNIATLGLLFGYLMGEALFLVAKNAIEISPLQPSLDSMMFFHIGLSLLAIYTGMTLTLNAADDLCISIPFVKFQPQDQKINSFLVDTTLLLDSRIIDLATSGLIDNRLVVPSFIIKEIDECIESEDENVRNKGRRCLDILKKLDGVSGLNLRYLESDYQEIKDNFSRLLKLAKSTGSDILTADANRTQQPSIEGVRIININALSNALKPLSQTGEFLSIKIQRYGKEPRQGVGYLDDGTMVVVNGGAEYIGETIRAQVLSVKHTSSGRMIFCNALEEMGDAETAMHSEYENSAKNYFAL